MNKRVEKLVESANELPHCALQVELFEQAVREADVHRDRRLAFDTRMELVKSATYAGYPEKALTAFSWCLACWDAHQDEFDWMASYRLMWQYKWILGNLPSFALVSREQIKQMQEDIQRRFLELGFGLRGVHVKRMSNAVIMGDLDEATRQYDLLQESKRDLMADCEACERSTEIQMLVTVNREEEAIQHAEPIVQGELSCATVPHTTYAILLEPLVRKGRMEKAKEYDKTGYRLASTNARYIYEFSDHMLYSVRTDNAARAIRLLEKHLPAAIESTNSRGKLWFFNAAAILFESLISKNGRARKIVLPATHECFNEDGKYKPTELQPWFKEQEESLIEQFNTRNGNEFCSQQIARRREYALG